MKKTPTRAERLTVMGKSDIDPFTPRRLSRARVKPLVVEKVKEQTPAHLRCALRRQNEINQEYVQARRATEAHRVMPGLRLGAGDRWRQSPHTRGEWWRPVMAITKCPIVMPPVNRFTVAPRALSQHRRTSDWMVRSLA